MMYATCAAVGCYNRIPYDTDWEMRPRYCEHCMRTHDKRPGAYTFVKPRKETVATLIVPPKKVIVRCPICKTRETVNASLDGYNNICNCGAKMIYHKDVE